MDRFDPGDVKFQSVTAAQLIALIPKASPEYPLLGCVVRDVLAPEDIGDETALQAFLTRAAVAVNERREVLIVNDRDDVVMHFENGRILAP